MTGTIDDGKAWRDKAKALDLYRWRLLRERHSLAGAALRFARDALNDFVFGLSARLLLPRAAPKSEPCDFLLLQSAPKVIAFQRKKLLIEALRGRGHNLVETALAEHRDILAKRQLVRPPQPVPLRYFGYAAYAEWLVLRHAPKILLNDRNGSLYSPFLRLSLNGRGRLLVHLAHATTVEGSRRLGMNDYDYYFLFGQSSLEALRARKLRFGESTAVLAGSHMIDAAFDLRPADPLSRTLLILGVGPDKEKERGYQETYALLRDWVERNPDYQVLFKAHPRSRAPFWHDASLVLDNLTVQPLTSSLSETLEKASLVINIMSNAVIEAGLARRPVLYVNKGKDQDIFEQEFFFGERIKDMDSLNLRIRSIEGNYLAHVCAAERFACFHLAGGFQGLLRTVECLESLANKNMPLDGLENAKISALP